MLPVVLGVSLNSVWPLLSATSEFMLMLLYLAASGFVLWMLLGTCYTIDGTTLAIYFGPFRRTITLRDIHSITPTRNPRSSPALSLDRLRIDYGAHRFIMISPREKEAFLRDIERRRS